MEKKPNAANITHGLAQLGGGSKKEGGGSMMKGMENIFKVGIEYGAKLALEGQQSPQSIDTSTILSFGDGSDKK